MKEYTQKIPVGKIQLTKEDLNQLVILSCSNPSQVSPRLHESSISTQMGDLTVLSENLDDFLHRIDLPCHLDNLSLQWIDRSSREQIDYQLSLQLGLQSSQLQISSFDETWTLGKSKQIMRFLQQKRPFPQLPWTKNTRIVLTAQSFWKDRSVGLTLLISLLSLLASLIFGILQLVRK